MKIIYSFNKKGYEAGYWQREIAGASNEEFQFIPFNHGHYLNPNLYIRAQLLDNLYYEKHPGLIRMYLDFENLIDDTNADAAIVDNCFPYHPDYLKKIPIYKVLRTSDGPLSAYDRDFAYLHAYDHVLYHSQAYSAEMGMAKKLRYCGAKNIDFWPLGVFEALYDAFKTEDKIFSAERNIDILFVGALHFNKMPILAKVKKVFGRRFQIFGLATWKRNFYYNFKYGFPGWIKPLEFKAYVSLYSKAKIGLNVHNRGKYTVGSYRLFDLPANGVMQISDGGEYLNDFFNVGEEIAGYENSDDLIDKLRYYLEHDEERERIALNGYRRVMKDHRISSRLVQAGQLITVGMKRSGWNSRKLNEF